MSGGLTELNAEYEDNDDFVLLSVGASWRGDTAEKQLDLAVEQGWDWAKVFDDGSITAAYYAVRGIPALVLVDPDGNARVIGGSGDMGEILSILAEGLDGE